MPITVSSRDSALTIALSGEIDHHAARELMAQLDQAIAERLPAHLVLDLSGPQREGMTVPRLLELFKEKAARELDNDRILMSP